MIRVELGHLFDWSLSKSTSLIVMKLCVSFLIEIIVDAAMFLLDLFCGRSPRKASRR